MKIKLATYRWLSAFVTDSEAVWKQWKTEYGFEKKMVPDLYTWSWILYPICYFMMYKIEAPLLGISIWIEPKTEKDLFVEKQRENPGRSKDKKVVSHGNSCSFTFETKTRPNHYKTEVSAFCNGVAVAASKSETNFRKKKRKKS